MKTARWYLRCVDCLSISVVEGGAPAAGVCGACEGRIEIMGRVCRKGSRLVIGERHDSPCDERCTNALGPNCDCPCGGENHGTRRVIVVEITAGQPPRISPARPDARARAEEWRALKANAIEAIAKFGRDAAQLRASGVWLDGADFARARNYQRWRESISRIAALRTHGGRTKAIAQLIASTSTK